MVVNKRVEHLRTCEKGVDVAEGKFDFNTVFDSFKHIYKGLCKKCFKIYLLYFIRDFEIKSWWEIMNDKRLTCLANFFRSTKKIGWKHICDQGIARDPTQ